MVVVVVPISDGDEGSEEGSDEAMPEAVVSEQASNASAAEALAGGSTWSIGRETEPVVNMLAPLHKLN
jgi:hypothetical protein